MLGLIGRLHAEESEERRRLGQTWHEVAVPSTDGAPFLNGYILVYEGRNRDEFDSVPNSARIGAALDFGLKFFLFLSMQDFLRFIINWNDLK